MTEKIISNESFKKVFDPKSRITKVIQLGRSLYKHFISLLLLCTVIPFYFLLLWVLDIHITQYVSPNDFWIFKLLGLMSLILFWNFIIKLFLKIIGEIYD